MKLWDKEYSLNKDVEKFTVGNDFLLDMNLLKYDIYASIAHAMMLKKIGILSGEELKKLKAELAQIQKLQAENKFIIKMEDEDCHTAIENYLTKKLGNLGKKIHTARSRNDQVLVDLRLYSKDKLLDAQKLTIDLIDELLKFCEKNKNIPIPGYTHSRKAMPSSIELLFGNFAESMSDNLEILGKAYEVNDQCPLGSGAGYGVPLEIDRQFASDLLGFAKVQNNVLYVQNSRGKFESFAVFALSSIMNDLSRLSSDLILFSMDEFGFFRLPDEFCTGSSIMPQKKNPDVLELIRAKSAKVDANHYLIKSIVSKLNSGYSRDLQLTKEPLIESFEITTSSLKIFPQIIKNLQVDKEKCINAFTPDLFATDYAYNLVKKGTPFRDAYKKTAEDIGKLGKFNASENIVSKKHMGATGNLNLELIKRKNDERKSFISNEIHGFNSKLKSLLRL